MITSVNSRLFRHILLLSCSLLALLCSLCSAVETPRRLFFSDAKLSFEIPDPWTIKDLQNWLGSVHILSRQEAGKLRARAHGGLWVHHTGGAKIEIPDDWLIGVADDSELGATTVRDRMHLAFTAVVDTLAPAA